jgi:peptide methionine sulfoxide reductase MsrA
MNLCVTLQTGRDVKKPNQSHKKTTMISTFPALLVFLVTFTRTDAFLIFPIGDAPKSLLNMARQESSSLSSSPFIEDRRTLLQRSANVVLSSLLGVAVSQSTHILPANALEEDELVEVYFGCGCFWHVQHEFVQAEMKYLDRTDTKLSSRAGYAGGKAGAVNGKVCYHNAMNVADYGKLGHAEVVSLQIPSSKFYDFAVEYCKLFRNGMRPDQLGDRGTEYRNLVGLPGGSKSPLAQQLVQASKDTGDQLDFAAGKGNDADIARLIWIMDIEKFPSYVAEAYHQFHDGFAMGENYPDSYNSLAQKFVNKGEDFGSCPNGMMGLGVGGL